MIKKRVIVTLAIEYYLMLKYGDRVLKDVDSHDTFNFYNKSRKVYNRMDLLEACKQTGLNEHLIRLYMEKRLIEPETRK